MRDPIGENIRFDELSRLLAEPGISRRTVLLGGLAAAGLVVLGNDVLSSAPAYASDAPQSAIDMANLALSLRGRTLRQLQSSPMTDAPWSTYSGDWCAVFGSWLMRATGVGYQILASGLYNAAPPVSAPQAGDIIHYPDEGHVGVVVGVNNGRAVTVEGNGSNGADLAWQYSWVTYHTSPWTTPYEFSRPTYPASTATPPPAILAAEDDQKMTIFVATSNSSDGLIKNGYMYVNNASGPLRALSSLEGSAVNYVYATQPVAQWPGEDIRSLVRIVGLYTQGAAQGLYFSNGTPVLNDGRLTGSIQY